MTGSYGVPNSQLWDTDIIVYDFESRTETNLTHRPGNDSYGAWSPDGSRIAHLTSEHGIWIMGADGSNKTFVPVRATRGSAASPSRT